MSLTRDLLIFLAAFIIVSYKGATAAFALEVDDEEDNLKQAIFLVELLKSDFGKVLRENNFIVSNAENRTEENSTCPTPTGNLQNVTEPASSADSSSATILTAAVSNNVSEGTTSTLSSPSTTADLRSATAASGFVTPGYGMPIYGAPGYGPGYAAQGYSAPGYIPPGYSVPGYVPPVYSDPKSITPGIGVSVSSPPVPGAPSFPNWPAMPNIPLPGYLPPAGYQQQGNFPADENHRFPYRVNRRRMMPDYYYFDIPPVPPQGNFRRQGSNDPPANITATTQTPITSTPSATSEVTNLPVVENRTEASNTLETVLPLSQDTPRQTQASTQMSPLQSTPLAQVSAVQTHPASGYTAPTIIHSKVESTPKLISKVSSAISKRKKIHKIKNASKSILRTVTTNDKYKSEELEMSQAASELLKEFTGNPTDYTPLTTNEEMLTFEQTKRRKASTTMKVYLRGSSRLPVPLPENNAFCHAYPRNSLCGSVM